MGSVLGFVGQFQSHHGHCSLCVWMHSHTQPANTVVHIYCRGTNDTISGCECICAFSVCAAVHAKWVCALPSMLFLPSVAVGLLISQLVPAESVAGPGYGPLVLILAQMIDSPEGETTASALWLAVNTLTVTLCHQKRKRRGKKAMKVTEEQAVGATGREQDKAEKQSKEFRASCQNGIYQFWQTDLWSQYLKNRWLSINYVGGQDLEITFGLNSRQEVQAFVSVCCFWNGGSLLLE